MVLPIVRVCLYIYVNTVGYCEQAPYPSGDWRRYKCMLRRHSRSKYFESFLRYMDPISVRFKHIHLHQSTVDQIPKVMRLKLPKWWMTRKCAFLALILTPEDALKLLILKQKHTCIFNKSKKKFNRATKIQYNINLQKNSLHLKFHANINRNRRITHIVVSN